MPLASRPVSSVWRGRCAHLDGIVIEAETVLLIGEKLLDLVALVALQLDHLAHALALSVTDDGSIASFG